MSEWFGLAATVLVLVISLATGVLGSTGPATNEALVQYWIPIEDLDGVEPGVLIGFSGDECPELMGWDRVKTYDDEPMFMAVGLLTNAARSPYDAAGEPYSTYEILTACRRR